ncbi:MAG: fructose-6-phosphate aldolase [Nitrososphaeraceae archaeon]|jgi:transaldolase|nr:fructose-6-phosphate aldolase [Thermoproteota archaeon]MDW0120690.1 fructose-6-phosphate aldolase [Nitrososphaeraceae archaeon]MDW0134719.1 fructose-6-phosphate aldolase [Nitrososphaeraceae archaeon]MDW0154942.1 fructose-6-phosphate aldolase [Nitrososphaeraceae archaeon]RPI84646.1 MAG: fructose-6-phosphate aldolase [Nitrosopumilales archaeon]
MKIFLDTASIESIKKFVDMGIVDGITTNPTLISREKGHPEDIMREIVKIVKGPVNLEVVATKTEEMVEEGLRLKKFGENVIVKVPMTSDGLKAVRKLAENKIKTNVTLIFSSNQALLAAKAGASYVSPFIGRLDDAGQEGMVVIKEIVQIFGNYGYSSEVLVASVRHPIHVIEAGKLGAHIVTLPPDILGKMLTHPLTDKGLALFLSDWEKVKKEHKYTI